MTLCTQSGSLLHHYEVFVDRAAVCDPNAEPGDPIPAVWFGLSSRPGHVWGCHVMLDNGAIYRDVEASSLAFSWSADKAWSPNDAQLWNCYGIQFSLIEYTFLRGMACQYQQRNGRWADAEYLFTAVPIGDGWSRTPTQAKEFFFLRTAGNRLTIQPTNKIQWKDRSFISPTSACQLKDLVTQQEWKSCDD